LQSGEFADHIDATSYDHRKATKDPAQSRELDKSEDKAGINRLERYATIYLTRDNNGNIEKLILPMRGYGLWSTLWGFMALQGDGNTVIGLSFFEHAETPGLGGEVDNPKWKALWPGKQVYNAEGEVALKLVKGIVDNKTPDAEHKVDALSGATLTSNGVSNLVNFWMGEQGFASFLQKLNKGQG
jgi:Na+-transporting NADH:ubiquinone oxidoreductase subunit C